MKKSSKREAKSRFEEDVNTLYTLDEEKFGVKILNSSKPYKFLLTVKPRDDLIISESCIFEIVLPEDYPEEPPSVFCLSADCVPDSSTLDIDKSKRNFVGLRMIEYHGWSPVYGIDCIAHALRLSLQRSSLRPSSRSVELSLPCSAEKETSFFSKSVSCERQGKRRSMEDASVSIDRLYIPRERNESERSLAFYAVFDGHGGSEASKFAARTLPLYVGRYLREGVDVMNALVRAFEDTEKLFISRVVSETNSPTSSPKSSLSTPSRNKLGVTLSVTCDPFEGSIAGTCASCVVLDGPNQRLWVANAGDSRALLCRNGRAIALSRDHKPTCPDEVARIVDAGGFVSLGRTNGQLAVSRSIGDYTFKVEEMIGEDGYTRHFKRMQKPIVSAEPEITTVHLRPQDDFVVVACDGLFDVMSNEDVVKFVRDAAASRVSAASTDKENDGATFLRSLGEEEIAGICTDLVDHAINDLKSRDNVSAILVYFKHGSAESGQASHDVSSIVPASSKVKETVADSSSPGLKISLDAPPMAKMSSIDELLEYASSPSHKYADKKALSPTSSLLSRRGGEKERRASNTIDKSVSDLDDSGLLDYLLDDANFSSPT